MVGDEALHATQPCSLRCSHILGGFRKDAYACSLILVLLKRDWSSRVQRHGFTPITIAVDLLATMTVTRSGLGQFANLCEN